jgi:uncharacterized protein
VEFEWDEDKARSNLKRHRISFEYATLVFEDKARVERPDLRIDYGEDRWLTIGLIDSFEVVVVYIMRGQNVRLISARKAKPDERKEYWENR